MAKVQLLENAYRKLKSSVYFDKTQMILKDKMVAYESKYKEKETHLSPSPFSMEDRFEQLLGLLEGEFEKWSEYQEELLKSIGRHVMPKSLWYENNSEQIISNQKLSSVKVSKEQYFIDADVEVHLLGVLWILTVGGYIDKELSDQVYGNRIKKHCVTEDNEITESPYLMQQYFLQYETWRDKGLSTAEEYMDKGNDVIAITMDLKSFYYSLDMRMEDFETFMQMDGVKNNKCLDKKAIKRLNTFIYKVCKIYSEKIPEKSNSRCCLPIGFLPSGILSNWCLSKFDSAVNTIWNPLYYGRYVDDIIIVDKIEANSYIGEQYKSKLLQHNELIESYLCNCKSNPKTSCEYTKGLFIKEKSDETFQEKEVTNLGQEYYLNPIYLNNDSNENVKIQNTKVKAFYFSNGGSKAILKSFQETINNNKSEFRLMPGEEDYFENFDYSNVYELYKEKNSSVNKFREINDVYVNKYNLSKFMGKMNRVCMVLDDRHKNQLGEDILKIFSKDEIISNYTLIERVLQQFIANENIDQINKFIDNVCGAINEVIYVNETDGEEDLEKTKHLKTALYRHLVASIHSSFALLWWDEMDNLINCVTNKIKTIDCDKYKEDNVQKFRMDYLTTYMVNMSQVVGIYNSDSIKSYVLGNKFNLTKFDTYMGFIKEQSEDRLFNNNYKYYPYNIKLKEIELCQYLYSITHISEKKLELQILETCIGNYGKLNNLTDKNKTIKELKNTVEQINIESSSIDSTYNLCHTKILDDKNIDKCKIAVANAIVKNDYLISLLDDKPNRSMDRYKKLRKIVDEAIKENVEVLVLPECYVPFEWLSLLSQVASKNKMLIIAGVEHIITTIEQDKKIALNLTATILPYREYENKYASHISLRNKVHYSPEEKKLLRDNRLEVLEGREYEIYTYKDLWFAVYCCFELSSIQDRSIFTNVADVIIGVEWNRDTKYYSNIMEALVRDMHCYGIQVNSAEYGDTRIIQPTKSEEKDIVQVKGGINDTILIGEIDVKKLREFQIKTYDLQQKDHSYKPVPPAFDHTIVERKIKGTFTFGDNDD